MFSKDLEYSIGQCYKQAREARHEFMTVEHLLLALLENPAAIAVLKACGFNQTKLADGLRQIIADSVPVLPADDARDTQPTLGFQRVLQRAVYHVQSSGKKEVTGANVLVAIFGEKDSHAVYLLQQQDISRLDVVNYLSHGIAKVGDGEEKAQPGEAKAESEAGEEIKGNPLQEFASNLNDLTRWSDARTRSSARSRCSAAGARTTRFTSASPAWARPPWPKAWPGASLKAACPRCWPMRSSIRLTWAPWLPAPNTVATSRSA
jgi:ATP-dependent Clp protease ATP-binding subunit ClpA